MRNSDMSVSGELLGGILYQVERHEGDNVAPAR